jgi:hypothetical protein
MGPSDVSLGPFHVPGVRRGTAYPERKKNHQRHVGERLGGGGGVSLVPIRHLPSLVDCL